MSNDKKLFEENPHQRFITTNLLISAALFEGHANMDITALENLCNAIDVFCLYDQAIVLGRDYAQFPNSDFFGALEDAKFITFIHRGPQQVDGICRIATEHLATVLPIIDSDRWFHLFQIAWQSEFHAIERIPDQAPTKTWTTQLELEQENLSRSNTFVARTFLYLASADQSYLALTPDIQRAPILAHFADQQEQFRGRILQVLTQRYQDSLQVPGYPELQGRVSPCAAIVFERAKGKKSNIPWEMTRLRKELTSTRESLRNLEQEIFNKEGDRVKSQAAALKWNDMISELEQSYLNPSFRNASTGRKLRSLLRMTPLLKDAAAIGAQPANPTQWIQALVDLPLEKVAQFFDRRTIIDLYDVLQPPNLLQLRSLVVPLFGESALRKPNTLY